jgi:CRISPR-associated protein Cmr6
MNLKHFYYRGYFDQKIKLAQPTDKDTRKKNEEANEKAFRVKNDILLSTKEVSPFSADNFLKVCGKAEPIHLRVKNPGLLPGIGYPHEVGYQGEFKLGFGFDHVTGLPVLPGSSVKGVLRSVFPQVEFEEETPRKMTKTPDTTQKAKADYIFDLLERLEVEGLAAYKNEAQQFVHALELAIFCGFDFSENPPKPRLPMFRHDVFLDVLPVQFNEENLLLGRDALTPHNENPLKNPIPLPFVKVLPGVVFGFYFKLNTTKIGTVEITAEHKRRLFCEILCTVGAGAKTNVGYGQFEAENAGCRIPKKVMPEKKAESQLQVGQTKPQAAAPQGKTAKYEFKKSLKGKQDIIGRVVSSGQNPVSFRIENIAGFEDVVKAKDVPASMLDKFELGARFYLTVYDEVNVEKKVLKVKIENFKPLP